MPLLSSSSSWYSVKVWFKYLHICGPRLRRWGLIWNISGFFSTAVRRHCTDWYEIWALTDHEIYYIKIELDLRKFSIGPFSETEKGFRVNPTPGGSQCTGLSPTLSWKWPRATLSPSFGPFFERNHSFGVKMVSENVWKTFKSCPLSWNPTGKKQIYMNRRRSYMNRHICKLFHFALSLLNSEIAITRERVARLTWFFGSIPKIEIYDTLFSKKNDFDQPLPRWRPPFREQYTVSLCRQ